MARPADAGGGTASYPGGRHARRSRQAAESGLSPLSEQAEELTPFEPRDGVPDVLVTPEAVARYAEQLAAGSGPLALDAERASGYRYSQRAYLVQLRREGAGIALIDPIAVPDLSAIQQATEGVEWILHAATQDLACLAEVGLRPSTLFDTELAGRLLGRERVSLSALVASELGLLLEKGHGATDWSVRPLSRAQLRYAALDVEVLVELRDVLDAELTAAGKRAFAQQEFDALLDFSPRDRGEEAWRRTSGIHRIRKPRDLAAVRALWLVRDDIARTRDIAVGRILPDAAIVAAVQAHPASKTALADLREFHGRGAQRYLQRWWTALQDAAALPDAELPLSTTPSGGPPQPRVWAERDPIAYARLETAKAAVAALAEQQHMPTENLISPDLVRRLCWSPPQPLSEEAVAHALLAGGARAWQVELACPALTVACAATRAPERTTAATPEVTGQ